MIDIREMPQDEQDAVVRLFGGADDIRSSDVPAGRSAPCIISAADLMRKRFPEPRWAVPGILPEGLTLLAGKPKLGKSWLALNLALAVAAGGVALGKIPVEAGDVLYLALEDTERRLQGRLTMLLDAGETAPARLHLSTKWPVLADGAIADLSAWLADHPEARLVIVDTFQRLRGPVPGNQNLYGLDYAAVGEIKSLADRHGVAVLLVHHTRKAYADDPLDMVSGTNGLAGAADAVAVLSREIGKLDAVLYLRGRDVAEEDHALSFDAANCAWTLLGDAASYRMSPERLEIINLLRDAVEPMAPKAIAEALDKKPGNIRYLLSKMVEAGQVVGLGGTYKVPDAPPNTANSANASPESCAIPRKSVSGTPVSAPNIPLTYDVGGVSRDEPVGSVRDVSSDYSRPGARTDDRDWTVWLCTRCHLPRSTESSACPNCGGTEGYLFRPSVGAGSHRGDSTNGP